MEECKVCGRANPIADANFCFYCGSSLREGVTAEQPVEIQPEQETTTRAAQKPMSMWRWFATFMLFFLPVYGWLAMLVILCLNAFGTNSTGERKEMSRGMLLFLLVFVVIMVMTMNVMLNDPAFLSMLESRTP